MRRLSGRLGTHVQESTLTRLLGRWCIDPLRFTGNSTSFVLPHAGFRQTLLA